MKSKSFFNKIIHNKLILYVVFILSILFFLGNIMHSNFAIVFYFVLIACFTFIFTKNMTIVLFIPLITVFLYSQFIQPRKNIKMLEGLENQNQNQNQNISTTTSSDQQKIDELKKNSNLPSSSSNTVPIIPLKEEPSIPIDESFKNSETKKTNSNKKKNYNIDYASTVEEAYDNLNNIIGSDGIKNLTGDTKRLMDQQLKLTEAMKNIQPLVETMGPLLEKAGGLLNSMGGSENIGNLADFAKNFSLKTK